MTRHLGGKVQKLTAAALLCAAIVAALVAATASGAQNSRGVVILSTSVTAVGPNGRATVTATLHPRAIGPQASRATFDSVTFLNLTTHKTLGSAPLKTRSGGKCTESSSSCLAKLSVSAHQLARNANRIVGVFNPHSIYLPLFRGAVWLYRGVYPACHAVKASPPVFTGGPIVLAAADRGPLAQAAAGGRGLCRGRVVNSGGASQVVVSSTTRAVVTKHTVIAFGNQTLPCSTPNGGDLLAFTIDGTKLPGSLAFQVSGRAATIAHRAHPNGYVCYESANPFRTASGTRSRRTQNGSYYGSLPHCGDNDPDDVFPSKPNGDEHLRPAPCIQWQQYSVKRGTPVWTTWIDPTDARLHY